MPLGLFKGCYEQKDPALQLKKNYGEKRTLIFEGKNNKVCDCSHPATMKARHQQKQKQTQAAWKFHPVEGSAAHKTRDPSTKRTHWRDTRQTITLSLEILSYNEVKLVFGTENKQITSFVSLR